MLILLLLLAATDPVSPGALRQPRAAALKRCGGDLAQIDYAAVARDGGRAILADIAAAKRGGGAGMRGALPDLIIPAGALVVSTAAGASHTQSEPTATASVAWRGRDGIWWFDRIDMIRRDGGEVREHSHGRLATDLAGALDAAFADRCLSLEPDYLPLPIPALTAGGRPPFIYGYPGVGGSLLIERGGRKRPMYQVLPQPRFRAIRDAVLYARVGPLPRNW